MDVGLLQVLYAILYIHRDLNFLVFRPVLPTATSGIVIFVSWLRCGLAILCDRRFGQQRAICLTPQFLRFMSSA